jgi:hypothetical protein
LGACWTRSALAPAKRQPESQAYRLTLRNCPPNLLGFLSLLACLACGCTTEMATRADDCRLDFPDATVGVGLDRLEADAARHANPSRPLLSINIAGGRIERARSGEAYVVLPGQRRMRLEPLEDARGLKLPLGLGVIGLVAEPLAMLPEALERSLRDEEGPAPEDAIAMAKQLLRVDPVRYSGTFGRRGRVNGWLRLTPAGRRE